MILDMRRNGARASVDGARSLEGAAPQHPSTSHAPSSAFSSQSTPLLSQPLDPARAPINPWERFWAVRGSFQRAAPRGRDGLPLPPSTLVDPHLHSFLSDSAAISTPNDFPFQLSPEPLSNMVTNPRLYEDACAYCLYYLYLDAFTPHRPLRESYRRCTLRVEDDRVCELPSLFYCPQCGNAICKSCQLFFRREHEACQQPKPFSLRRVYSRAYGSAHPHSALLSPVPMILPREIDPLVGTSGNPILIGNEEDELSERPIRRASRLARYTNDVDPLYSSHSSYYPGPTISEVDSAFAAAFAPAALSAAHTFAAAVEEVSLSDLPAIRVTRYADDFDLYPPRPIYPVPTISEVDSAFAAAFAPAALSAVHAFAAADEAVSLSDLPATTDLNLANLRSGLQQGDPLSSLYHFLASASLAPWP